MRNNVVEKYFSFVKTLLPERVVKPSVGLDIGTHSCKLVEILAKDDTYQILNWAVEPIIHNDMIGAVKRSLRNIETKNPSTAVAGKGTLIRYVDMPRMPLEDLRKSIEIESDKHFPFPKEQIYTDCYIIEPKSKENMMSVLLAAAKKEIVDQRMQFLSSLGLQPDVISINVLAIANIFNLTKEEGLAPAHLTETTKSNTFAILDIGHSITSLLIIKDRFVRFTRDIFVGGRDFDKRISNILAVPLEEAEKIKCHPQEKREMVLHACESILQNLISETRLSFDYFVTEHNVQISKLFLTGGSSGFIGLQESFSKNLDLPVERWDPLSPFRLSPHLSSDEINPQGHKLGVALGLALLSL